MATVKRKQKQNTPPTVTPTPVESVWQAQMLGHSFEAKSFTET